MFIIIALASYLLGAMAVILDKFLLGSKRVSSPAVYSFYIALFGLAAMFLAPFGFFVPSAAQIILSLISGAFFTFGILSLYFAIQKSEASRVTPIVGAVTPIATCFLSLFFGENLGALSLAGVFLLISGGLLISFDLPLKININKNKFFSGFYPSILAGVLLAIAYFLFKFVYMEQNFVSGFIWTRIGAFLGAFSLFAVSNWRREILRSFKNFEKPKKQEYQTGGIFVADKIVGGLSSILLNLAIMLGSVTVVNSLISTQYVFVLIAAWLVSRKYSKVFEEKLLFWDWAQKIAAIVLIGAGIFLISK